MGWGRLGDVGDLVVCLRCGILWLRARGLLVLISQVANTHTHTRREAVEVRTLLWHHLFQTTWDVFIASLKLSLWSQAALCHSRWVIFPDGLLSPLLPSLFFFFCILCVWSSLSQPRNTILTTPPARKQWENRLCNSQSRWSGWWRKIGTWLFFLFVPFSLLVPLRVPASWRSGLIFTIFFSPPCTPPPRSLSESLIRLL